MLFFGILTCSKKPPAHITDRVKANADPKVEFFCFSFFAIEPISNQVNGYRFCKETTDWKEASFPIPSILYDQCFYDTKEKRRTGLFRRQRIFPFKPGSPLFYGRAFKAYFLSLRHHQSQHQLLQAAGSWL